MADGVDENNSLDVSKLKVAELKKELKARGLSTTGNKNDLMERLHLSMQGEGALMMESELGTADSEEILDEDEVLAGEEVLDDDIGDISGKTDDIIPNLGDPEEKVKEEEENDEKSHQLPKKIVLNRNIIVSGKENQKEPEESNKQENSEKKIIKISALTAKERLEMRAQKFGVPLSVDAKKEARAARFGITAPTTTSTTTTSPVTSTPNLDLLKQRAERFGSSVSSALSKVEQAEKLKKRQERFGLVEAAPPAKKSNLSLDEKKRLRAERFKINK
ncbi:hypothetical protein R5R35_000973 [Gryllus longicercus]|uniref:SAP domain-containing protein n=1 Tax=Gryllus longicercus TaxID=2509291 RepID=A0AAN9Z009_9ORTH